MTTIISPEYKEMLELIFNSDFAKEWIKEREKDLQEEKEFYGRELTEKEWKLNLIDEFLGEDLKNIVAVLPDLWERIQEEAKDNLEDILDNPTRLEEHITRRGYLETNFKLNDFLGEIEDDLAKTLKLIMEKTD
ncbi:hypothetical protein ES703_100594 [subsurface metagenome]